VLADVAAALNSFKNNLRPHRRSTPKPGSEGRGARRSLLCVQLRTASSDFEQVVLAVLFESALDIE